MSSRRRHAAEPRIRDRFYEGADMGDYDPDLGSGYQHVDALPNVPFPDTTLIERQRGYFPRVAGDGAGGSSVLRTFEDAFYPRAQKRRYTGPCGPARAGGHRRLHRGPQRRGEKKLAGLGDGAGGSFSSFFGHAIGHLEEGDRKRIQAAKAKGGASHARGRGMFAVGTKEEVFMGEADHTRGGLRAEDLMENAKGVIVSRRKSEEAHQRFAGRGRGGYVHIPLTRF